MSQTGTYVLEPGKGLVKVSPEGYVPNLASSVYVPKGDVPHYDPSARVRFDSKAQKRQWMKRWGLKEGGLIRNTDQRLDFSQVRNAKQPSVTAQAQRARNAAWVRSQGGTEGLLQRLATRKAT
jgi:hypothetical protein